MTHSRTKRPMINRRFGRLVVLREEEARNKNGHITYLCRCDCGETKSILGASLRAGSTSSCGCLQLEAARIHGMDGTPEYRTWVAMRSRCSSPTNPNFDRYGARGITVCRRWDRSFAAFLKDMGARPKGCTIDRIDNNGNYCPGNCRWATPKKQAQNRRNTVMVQHGGRAIFISEFAAAVGLSDSGARKRVQREYVKGPDGVFVRKARAEQAAYEPNHIPDASEVFQKEAT